MTDSISSDDSRYRGLILSIAVFLTLLGGLLVLTFYASKALDQQAVKLELSNAGLNHLQLIRQDVMALKSTLDEPHTSPYQQALRASLTRSAQDMQQLVSALGEVGDDSAPLKSWFGSEQGLESSDQIALSVSSDWQLLKPPLDNYLQNATDIRVDRSAALASVVQQADSSLLSMTERLTMLARTSANNLHHQAYLIRLLQILGVAAILGYFMVFVFYFIRKLAQSESRFAKTRSAETHALLQAVRTGLFLLDKDLRIGQQRSKMLLDFVGTDRLGGKNLVNILRGHVSEQDLHNTQQRIEQLYDTKLNHQPLEVTDSLHNVMLNKASADHRGDSRYLDFTFGREDEGQGIARILVNVIEVADSARLDKRLEQRLAQQQPSQDTQVEMLNSLLNSEPEAITTFVDQSTAQIEAMMTLVTGTANHDDDQAQPLQQLYSDITSLKWSATKLTLTSLTSIATALEDRVLALQSQESITDLDRSVLKGHLDDLLSLMTTIAKLNARINPESASATTLAPAMASGSGDLPGQSLGESANDERAQPNSAMGQENIKSPDSESDHAVELDKPAELVRYSQDLVQNMAALQQKQVRLETTGLTEEAIPPSLRPVIKAMGTELLKNAVVHGIEAPKDRTAKGKAAIGQIIFSVKNSGDKLMMTLQDDGQGIDYDRIRQRLVTMGQYSAAEVDQLNNNQLLTTLFYSGFTTKSAVDEAGGEGVGLDIIKANITDYQGELNVFTEKDKLTRFSITLPIHDLAP